MRKKILALFLALVMITATAAGCSKESGGNKKKGDDKTDSSNATTEEHGTAEENNEVTEKQTVKVGVMTPLSGQAALMGEYYQDAIEVAMKHIEEDGYLKDYRLEFEYVDDKCDTAEAPTASNYVIDQYGADVAIGHLLTTMHLVSGQFFEDAQIPMIGIVSGPASVQQGWKYSFIATGTDLIQADTLLKYLVEEKEFSKIAILNVNTEGGMSAATRIEDTLKKVYNLDLVGHELHGAEDTDFTAQVLKFKEAGAESVIFWGGSQSQANIFMKLIEQLWGKVPEDVFFAGGSQLAQTQMLENWDLNDLADVTFPTGFTGDMSDERVARFVNDFISTNSEGDSPADVPARVYDAVYHIATALNDLGPYDVNADDFSIKLRDAMTKASFEGVQGHFDFSQFEDGQGLPNMNICAWTSEGKISKVWPK